MENVTETDRGQLIAITGLAIALALVVLVLLLNSVIYTGNLATRSTDSGSQPAIVYQQTTVEDVGGLVDRVNAEEYDGWPTVESEVKSSIKTYDSVVRKQYLDRGVFTDIDESSLEWTDGYLIRQTDSSRQLTDKGTQSNWMVVQDVPQVRDYQLTVEEGSLATTDTPSSGFYVGVADSETASQWNVYLYEDTTANEIQIAVKNGSETSPTTLTHCAVSDTTATIDLTAGTVNGERCAGLQWAAGVSGPYSVTYQNGDLAQGTYELTVEQSADMDALRDTHLNGPTGSTSPYYSYAVYSVSFDVIYETNRLEYRAPVRVAPGEPS